MIRLQYIAGAISKEKRKNHTKTCLASYHFEERKTRGSFSPCFSPPSTIWSPNTFFYLDNLLAYLKKRGAPSKKEAGVDSKHILFPFGLKCCQYSMVKFLLLLHVGLGDCYPNPIHCRLDVELCFVVCRAIML